MGEREGGREGVEGGSGGREGVFCFVGLMCACFSSPLNCARHP